ncbi:hypothetical protein [Lactiplantibacillus plantarum]|jgi:uncharacterized membrane protein|uniref:Holin n=1 Tax=Siphoviridae sp. ctk5O4 TaxID=2827921 RepID=A0A8S5SJT6_9CAUD|nr:hypothetical protein [Lactiplantibacillus plantarum]DAF51222.1 MAG TPA: holin [Siphoviridae sp. ctk5O4]KLD41140.1 holin [Lactiplantibacillus plantarum]KLD61310.1 holin [Lactiplantibacillus plantarum]MCG3568972.1 holin [Lactiplantibacillus plantarum]MCG3571932.1 holin [Lactiplantibacillus plantarum]
MTKFLNVIQATFKANYKKPAYWAQVVGSVLIIGLAVATVFLGIKIDSNAIVMVITAAGAVLAFVGAITDNSILEDTGNTIKTKSNVLASTEQTVVEALAEAQAKIEAANSAAASQSEAQASQAVVAAYSQAASAATTGDMVTAQSAASLAASLGASTTVSADSSANKTSEHA